MKTEDFYIGPKAFAKKQKPQWTGRMKKGAIRTSKL